MKKTTKKQSSKLPRADAPFPEVIAVRAKVLGTALSKDGGRVGIRLASGEHLLVPTTSASAIAWSSRIGKMVEVILVPMITKKTVVR